MRIYEILGIKIFRKMAFAIRDKVWILFTLKMTKEQRKNYLYHTASNYNIGKINSLEDIQSFKKQLFSNALIHLAVFICCILGFDVTATLSSNISPLILGGINLYCVMLQRYNCIRVNQLIKRMTPHYEK